MKVLWLSHLVPYPPKAGVLQRCFYLIKELSKYHDIDLMTFVQTDMLRSIYKDLDFGLAESRKELLQIVNSVEYFDIPSELGVFGKKKLALLGLISPAGYTIEWLKSHAFSDALKRKLAQNKYDLVHFDTISLAVYRKYIKDTATMLDHHNIESHMMLRRFKKENNLFKKIYFYQEGIKLYLQEKKWCQKFDINITCSDIDSRRLKKTVGDIYCASIPNGVDVNYFKPTYTETRQNSLIFIGTMNWYPNVEAVKFILDEIWPALRNVKPEVTLDIVGSSPPNSIMKYNGQHGITVHGFVDDVRPLFDSAHLYICPITDGGGTKLKILDAMAMGKAIIAHPVACEGIDLVDGESVVFCHNAEEFILAIKTLLNDKEKVLKLGQNARKLAMDNYAFEYIGRKLSNLITEVVNNTGK